MTKRIANLVQWMFIVISISNTAAVGVGESCDTQENCTVSNSTCDPIDKQCTCLSSYALVNDTCLLNECGSLDPILNGRVVVNFDNETQKYSANYSCNSGYRLTGETTRTCILPDFEGEAPTCQLIVCDPLPPLPNGSTSYSSGDPKVVGTNATFDCDPGFTLNGTEQTVCLATGSFEDYSVSCDDINECTIGGINNCHGNATCQNTPGSFICACLPSFIGNGINCIFDVQIQCQSKYTKKVYLERNPTLEQKSICLRKEATTSDDICYNPSEGIIYQYGGTDLTVAVENNTHICLVYNGPDTDQICDSVTAYDGDLTDSNTTIELCFLFNTAPVFVDPASLSYNVPDMVSMEMALLTAIDTDSHQNLTFVITGREPALFGNTFSIEDNSLVILKPDSLISDETEAVVSIQVSDNGRPSLSVDTNITIQFTFEQLSCSASDEPFLVHLDPAPVSPSKIGQISCVDVSENQGLAFSVTDIEGPFTVDANGDIYYNTSASNVNAGEFTATVEASVQQPVPTTTEVTLNLIADDFTPSCAIQGSGISSFDEHTTAGSCHEFVYACTEKAGVQETCAGGSDLFNITCEKVVVDGTERTEVSVCVASDLRTKYGNYSVSGNITNQYGTTSLDFDVEVTNVNDGPVIQSTMTTFNLSETARLGGTLSTFDVVDPDRALQPPLDSLSVELTYADSSAASMPFLASLNAAQDLITITLTGSLNFVTKPSYSLRLTVTDSGNLTDFILLTVNIENVNEEPSCLVREIDTSASVQNEVGYQIAELLCSDPDNDVLMYSLDGPDTITSYFQVNESGKLTIKRQLVEFTDDNTVVKFKVIVADAGSLQTYVNISVTIRNSFPPVCNPNTFETIKSEKTDANVCFTIQTSCEDPVQNEALTFNFTSGNGTQLFRIGTQGNQNDLPVCTKENLQDQYGTYKITVSVTSSYGQINLFLTISVNDQNDPPSFLNAPYVTSVDENTGIGTTIYTVSAQDLDSGIFGDVTFQSIDLDDSTLFSLNKDSGEITVKSDIDADSSNVLPTYTFNIKAIDGSLQQRLSADTTITITINDTNDNPPTCTDSAPSVTVLLTLPVGEPVFQLDCRDNDRTPAFSDLIYGIDFQTVDVFSVNENGTVVLSELLSQTQFRDIQEHSVTVRVSDESQSTTVQLTVLVNSAIPPTCTPTVITKSFRETQPQGSCLDVEVKCVDPTDPSGSKLNVQSGSGSGAQLLEIRQAKTDTFLGINACTNTTLRDRFGTYQLVGVVTNGLASTSIEWTFTVTNVNDAPTFNPAFYNVSVNETVAPSTSILKLTVSDRDDSTANQSFHLKEVTVDLINNADFDNRASDVLLYVAQGARMFYSTGTLNATDRNLYEYIATAKDNSGLSSTAMVYINILDVNSPPVCSPETFDQTITILDPPGTMIQQLSCYDTDIDPLNVYLDYEVDSGDPDGYFNVTEDGAVTVQKPLPRTRLYNTRTASLIISVRDRGTPSQSTNVAITIYVNNTIPATCSPVVTPPNLWVIGECVTITMDCVDPTTEGVDHLVYTVPSGNYTLGFERRDSPKGTFVLCYTQTKTADYELTVNVDNGLSLYIKTLFIQVSYEQATPVFNTTKYERNINEDTSVNTKVLTVEAKSQNLIGQLVYRVLDADSFNSWGVYFRLDSATGVITTKDSIRSLANQLITLRIEAEDTGSKLKSSTQVEINVIDINEAPVCLFTRQDLAIDVDVAVGTQIVQFTCTDNDTKPEYQQLNYQLTGETDYFALEAVPAPTSIFVQQSVDVTTSSYTLQLTVSDSADDPLSQQKSFQIDVSLVPPPVLVEAVALKYDLIRVNWRYQRDAYKSVTNSYKVLLRKTDNSEIMSADLPSTLKNYNMTRLTEKTTYTVVVMANTRYGSTNSTPVVLTTPEIPKLANFTATIRIPNIIYSPDLRGDSQFYQRTKKTVLDSLEFVLKPTAGYAGVDIKGFRQANSIYADFIVFVNQSGSVGETIRSLNSSVQSGWLDSMSVDSGYLIASEGDGYILIDSVVQLPVLVFNGTSANLTCNIVKIGYPSSTTFEYWWTFYGNRISPTSQSRYRVTNIEFSPSFPEYAQTVLVIDPMLTSTAGSYRCLASVRGRDPVTEMLQSVGVVSQPVMSVYPNSKTVTFGDTVIVICQLITPIAEFKNFVWYRDGVVMELNQGESINDTVLNEVTLTVVGIRNSTVFGCAGVNNAGVGQTVYSYIGVLPTDASDEDRCTNNTDSRGTLWETAAAGTLSTKACPKGYTGRVTRQCSDEGTFKIPVYDCVKDTILALANEVKALSDGASSANVSYVYDKLAMETNDLDLYNGDIDAILEMLESVNQVVPGTQMNLVTARKETDDLLQIASNLIAERNRQTWESKIQQEKIGAIDVPRIVEDFLNAVANNVGITSTDPLKVQRDYVYTELCRDDPAQRSEYSFPDRASNTLPDWVKARETGISVKSLAFSGFNQITFAGTFYKNITSILVKTLKRNGVIEDVTGVMDFNADIVSFGVKENVGALDPPAVITFDHFDTNYSQPLCVFWDYDASAFSTDGCRMLSTSETQTVCECYHLTNFAVLMSPGKTPEKDILALSIISAVGCGISLLCLFITILLHLIVWRLVKSDRAVLLMNLCVALIVSYVLFLAGIDRADNANVCTVVSVLLHFFYLVVFFLMLAYGLEIGVSVIYVFATRSRIRWLLPFAWAIPAVIVGISVGVTKLEGYGNDEFCWLSIDSGLLWAFVGPAAFVIVINLIIVIAVFRKMFKSSAMMTKSDKEKAKTGVRSICVLLPILGLTWVFGVFSVNEDMVAFQYVFTVCNSLQGFLILLFHCIFHSQLRDALQHRSNRKKSLASFETTFKNQHSTTTSTSFHSDKSSKQNNTELEIPNTSTNPFLEADRQMKEMVAKNKKGHNMNDLVANNKIDKDKGKPKTTVDLEDVKISNILRESEVMGGTAGISSILQAQTTENELDSVEIKHGEDTPDSSTPGKGNTSSTGYQTQQPKPEGYEKLLQQSGSANYYDKVKPSYNQQPQTARSFDDVDAEIERIRNWEKEKEREKERKRAMDQQKEREREMDKQRQKEREREKERQRQMEIERKREKDRDPMVIKIGYDTAGQHPEMRVKKTHDGSYDKKGSRSSRSDEDLEGSAQNISSIKTAIPMQYDNKRPQDISKKTDTKKKDKNKKKPSVKDRSRAYEYPYDATYLGGSSRHGSLENMNMQQYGYSPYAQMPGMGGYQTGARPSHQQVHWDQYRYPPRGQQRGDYW